MYCEGNASTRKGTAQRDEPTLTTVNISSGLNASWFGSQPKFG
jgi:hypothetical protein